MEFMNEILNEISNELNISATMYKEAISSYGAVGRHLKDKLGVNINNVISVYPQGSFNLGTVVKPLTDEDSGYDIDLVVSIDHTDLNAKETKKIVGKALSEHKLYFKTLDEGNRCWTLQYNNFHMDILPSISDHQISVDDIKITHRIDLNSYIFKASNPKGYKNWFDGINEEPYNLTRKEYAQKYNLKIEEVPEYNVRTTLQRTIQILKRHRSIMFKDRENAPISIIITTLAAKSFSGNKSLYEELKNIILSMKNHIDNTDGVGKILNPVNPLENFADKWLVDTNKEKNFHEWLDQLLEDFIYIPNNLVGLNEISIHFSTILGEKATQRSVKEFAKRLKQKRDVGELYLNDDNQLSEIKSDVPIENHTFYGEHK